MDRATHLKAVKYFIRGIYHAEDQNKHYTPQYRLATAARRLAQLEALDWAIAMATPAPRKHRAAVNSPDYCEIKGDANAQIRD
jgi:hypothetical protein